MYRPTGSQGSHPKRQHTVTQQHTAKPKHPRKAANHLGNTPAERPLQEPRSHEPKTHKPKGHAPSSHSGHAHSPRPAAHHSSSHDSKLQNSIESLYQKDLLRDADKGGLQYYEHEYQADRKHGISGKEALSQINRQLETSSEGQRVKGLRATVNRDFKQYLYRSAGKQGENFYARMIKSGKIKASDLPDILKSSHEYRTWVAPAVDAYQQELGRTPGAGDRGGVERLIRDEHWWSEHGKAGPSQFQHFDEGQIRQSPEYKRKHAPRAGGGSSVSLPFKAIGSWGGQCVSFVGNVLNGGGWPRLTNTYASEMMTDQGHPGFTAVATPQPGDAFVMGQGISGTGHTGIVVSANADGSLTVLDSNYGENGVIQEHTFTAQQVQDWVIGYLRPDHPTSGDPVAGP